jgi:DNA replication protein DnaC
MTTGHDRRAAIPAWADIGWPIAKARYSNFPDRHLEACCDPQRLLMHDDWRDAYIRLAAALSDGKNLAVLSGAPGTGKTQLATAVALRVIQQDVTTKAAYASARDMFDTIREQFGADGTKDARPKYRDPRILGVDVVEKCTWTDWERQEFETLIRHRYDKTRGLTVLISNLGYDELRRRLGPSVASRLDEFGACVRMSGWSFRGGVA